MNRAWATPVYQRVRGTDSRSLTGSSEGSEAKALMIKDQAARPACLSQASWHPLAVSASTPGRRRPSGPFPAKAMIYGKPARNWWAANRNSCWTSDAKDTSVSCACRSRDDAGEVIRHHRLRLLDRACVHVATGSRCLSMQAQTRSLDAFTSTPELVRKLNKKLRRHQSDLSQAPRRQVTLAAPGAFNARGDRAFPTRTPPITSRRFARAPQTPR